MKEHIALIAPLFSPNGEAKDYEKYLKTQALLSCQKPLASLVNSDELQFQIVHQVEELWMKLIAHSLATAIDCIHESGTHRAITLIRRGTSTLSLMTEQLTLLETMSPKDYQVIRLQLGNGSGQESPGFRVLLHIANPLWQSFKTHYLDHAKISLKEIYDSQYQHDATYLLAEALTEYDERFQRFRFHHLQLIHRSIGPEAHSLKGRPIEILEQGVKHRLFPELWQVRSDMTDSWGQSYGKVRAPIDEK